jgi:uncharacterized tellurite resistance protein B-like protein
MRIAALLVTLRLVSFSKLLHRFRNGINDGDSNPAARAQQDPMRLATAAILLDIGYADGEFSPSEGEDLVGYLRKAFALTDEMAKELIEAASEIRTRTIDHWALTSLVKKNASLDERIEIVRTMWRIVYSDGKLTDYENYLVRKLADLLGLEHHVMIEAKVGVLRELGLATT